MDMRFINNKGSHETAVKVGLGAATAAGLAVNKAAFKLGSEMSKSGSIYTSALGKSIKSGAKRNTAIGLAAVMGIYALYKFANVPRSGTIVAAYTLNGMPKSEEIFKFNKGDTNKDIKAKITVAKRQLKDKGAQHIKCKAVFDKSRIAQVKENLMNMIKKGSNSREALNSRCIEIYS